MQVGQEDRSGKRLPHAPQCRGLAGTPLRPCFNLSSSFSTATRTERILAKKVSAERALDLTLQDMPRHTLHIATEINDSASGEVDIVANSPAR